MTAIPRTAQHLILAGCTVLAALLPTSARAQFTSPPTYAAGVIAEPSTAVFSAVGDLNGDGRPDLAAVDVAVAQVVVRINTTTPGSAPSFHSVNTVITVTSNPRRVAIGDMNGDGKPDLVVTAAGSGSPTNSGTVQVFMNNTSPGAQTASFVTIGAFTLGGLENPLDVAIADFNGDGVLDLAVAETGSFNDVLVLKNATPPNNGIFADGGFQFIPVGTTPRSLAVGDFNGDGRLDLAVANQGSANVSLLRNDPDTSGDPNDPGFNFQPPVNVSLTATNPSTIVTGDFNGDGKLDLAVSGGLSSANVFLLRNQTSLGPNPLSFAAPEAFAAGSSPTGMALGDVNGDGKPDLVTGNLASGTVSTLINITTPGASSMTFAAKVDTTVGPQPASVLLRDMNSDGRPDVLVGDNTNKNVQVLRNTTPAPVGGAAFASAVTKPGDIPIRPVLGDVNGDGRPDLVIAQSFEGKVSVALNDVTPGTGILTPSMPGSSFRNWQAYSTGNTLQSVALVDVNGDGKPDLIAGDESLNTVNVLLNDVLPGTVTLTPGTAGSSFRAAQPYGTGASPSGVMVADVNGDGRPDLIVANQGSNSVSILLNDVSPGTGSLTPGTSGSSFKAAQAYGTGASPNGVMVADVNGDGRPDLIVANRDSNSVSVLLNDVLPGTGMLTPGTPGSSFKAAQSYGTGSLPLSVAAGDVNGDGKPDVIVANRVGNSVSVLLNDVTPGTTLLSPSSSGSSFKAGQTYGAGALPRSVVLADVNGDGRLDVIAGHEHLAAASVLLNDVNPGTPTLTDSTTGSSFKSAVDHGTGARSWDVTVGDVNGDGKPDLITAGQNAGSVSVLLNTPFGAVRIEPSTGTIAEGGAGLIPIVRRDGSATNGPVSVTLAAAGGSATLGSDYGFTGGTLTWAQGDVSDQSGNLSTTNDSAPEGDETILFTLSNPTPGLGLAGEQALTIIDDECAGKNIGVSVTPGSAGVLNVTVTSRSPALITSILFRGGGSPPQIPATNATYTISGQGPRTGDFIFSPGSPLASVQFTLTRTSGSGTATLPFDVTDQCGTQAKLVGGGANAWGGGSGPESPPQGGPAPAMPIPTTPPVPGAACATFPTHAAAQAHHPKDPTDPLLLDKNRNGIACEGADGAGFVNPPLDQVPVTR